MEKKTPKNNGSEQVKKTRGFADLIVKTLNPSAAKSIKNRRKKMTDAVKELKKKGN